MKKLFLILGCALLAACSKEPATSFEVPGKPENRVELVTRILKKHTKIRSTIVDAYYREEIPDGARPGPVENTAFCVIVVAPADIAAWRSVLQPLPIGKTILHYVAPRKPAAWWLTEKEFIVLKLYSPELLTGRTDGWVGLDANTGKIYVYSFVKPPAGPGPARAPAATAN